MVEKCAIPIPDPIPADVRELVPGRHLFLLERMLAKFFLSQRASYPPDDKLNQTYGPEGLVLYGAGGIYVLFLSLGVFSGLGLLLASGGHPPLDPLGYWLIAAGIVIGIPGVVRFLQAAEAGKRFRNGSAGARPAVPGGSNGAVGQADPTGSKDGS